MIGEKVYDLVSGNTFQSFSNTSADISTEDLYSRIVNAYRSKDHIITWGEVYFGGFHFRDYIILNEIFRPVQKWDISLCTFLFNSEKEIYQTQFLNTTREEHYMFCTKDSTYRDRLLNESRNLALVNLHLEFESLGGKYDSPSRFVDIIERAGWDIGTKMIKALLSVLKKMQMTGKLGNEDIKTRMSDRLQSDDHDVIYRFYPGNEGYLLYIRHLIDEDTTSVKIIKDGVDGWDEEVFGW